MPPTIPDRFQVSPGITTATIVMLYSREVRSITSSLQCITDTLKAARSEATSYNHVIVLNIEYFLSN